MNTPRKNDQTVTEQGAVCQMCGRRMLSSPGCTWQGILIRDVRYPRKKYGEEEGWPVPEDGARCPDCGALPGHYHHFGCDVEREPNGPGQLISLDEDWAYTDTVGD